MGWLQRLLCMGHSSSAGVPSDAQPAISTAPLPTETRVIEEEEDSGQVALPTPQHQGSSTRHLQLAIGLERVTSIPEDRPAELDSLFMPGAPSSPHSPIHSSECSQDVGARPRSNTLGASGGASGVPPSSHSGWDLGKRSYNSYQESFLMTETRVNHSSPGLPDAPRAMSRRDSRRYPLSQSRLSVGGGLRDHEAREQAREILELQQGPRSFIRATGSPSSSQINLNPKRTSETNSPLRALGSSASLQRLRSNGNLLSTRLANSRSVSLALGLGLPPSQEKRRSRPLIKAFGETPASMPEHRVAEADLRSVGRLKSGAVRPRPATVNYLEDVEDDKGEATGPRSKMDGSKLFRDR